MGKKNINNTFNETRIIDNSMYVKTKKKEIDNITPEVTKKKNIFIKIKEFLLKCFS